MLDGTQDDELIRQAAVRHSVAPDIISELLALASKFENVNIYGAKVEFTRAVERILDGANAKKDNGAKR
ncbi:hypothetical protein ACSFBI_31440 [Variovorax sp. RB3P1]|uniref:hypothetical protein n=1 Tax=Variovorax sp. RB3P1 TaxID=3443732 RepID=UPI003F45B90A